MALGVVTADRLVRSPTRACTAAPSGEGAVKGLAGGGAPAPSSESAHAAEGPLGYGPWSHHRGSLGPVLDQGLHRCALGEGAVKGLAGLGAPQLRPASLPTPLRALSGMALGVVTTDRPQSSPRPPDPCAPPVGEPIWPRPGTPGRPAAPGMDRGRARLTHRVAVPCLHGVAAVGDAPLVFCLPAARAGDSKDRTRAVAAIAGPPRHFGR